MPFSNRRFQQEVGGASVLTAASLERPRWLYKWWQGCGDVTVGSQNNQCGDHNGPSLLSLTSLGERVRKNFLKLNIRAFLRSKITCTFIDVVIFITWALMIIRVMTENKENQKSSFNKGKILRPIPFSPSTKSFKVSKASFMCSSYTWDEKVTILLQQNAAMRKKWANQTQINDRAWMREGTGLLVFQGHWALIPRSANHTYKHE